MFFFFYFLVEGPELWRYHIVPYGALDWYMLFCTVMFDAKNQDNNAQNNTILFDQTKLTFLPNFCRTRRDRVFISHLSAYCARTTNTN